MFTEIYRLMHKEADSEYFFKMEEVKKRVDGETAEKMIEILYEDGYFTLIKNDNQHSVSKPVVNEDGSVDIVYWYFIKDEVFDPCDDCIYQRCRRGHEKCSGGFTC